MIPRLTICFGLSVLLHGMLLLSAAPAFRSGGSGHFPTTHVETRKLDVFLKSESSDAKPAGAPENPAKRGKPEATSRGPVNPLLAPDASTQPAPAPGWLVQSPPAPRNAQMNYQQIYQMQTRQQAMQQTQQFAARLQADIEQSIASRADPVTGQCRWRGDSSVFQCVPVALQHWIQPETGKLRALRDARRALANPLDGFAIDISDNGASIIFHGHSENSEGKD